MGYSKICFITLYEGVNMNNKFYTVCGIVEIDEKIVLVRHTYGAAKGRILLPGGYVQESELPARAAERELLEETGIVARTEALFAMQFKPQQWCAVFTMEYVSGTPTSDNYENSEILLLTPAEAVAHGDITNMSREILRAYISDKGNALEKSNYVPLSSNSDEYEIYGV